MPHRIQAVIVEDDPDIAFLLGLQVGEVSDEVRAAALFDGIEEAKEGIDWTGVHVAIVDWMLQGGHRGSDLIEWLAQHHPHVRRILISAAHIPSHEHGLADAVIMKGFDNDDLVNEVLRGAVDRNGDK